MRILYLYHPRSFQTSARLVEKQRQKKQRVQYCSIFSYRCTLYLSLIHRLTNEELLLLLSQSWGKFEKNGEEEEEKKNLVSLPDVLRVVSRRAPRRHHVTNLVRVAFESVALVFLFIFCAYERERERERVALVAFPIKIFAFAIQKCSLPLRACPARASSWKRRPVVNLSCGVGLRVRRTRTPWREGGVKNGGRLSLCFVCAIEKRVQIEDFFLSVEKQ